MNSVKKQVILDILVSPVVILPAMVGASCLILSWAIASATLAFWGIVGVLGAGGIAVTRAIFNFEDFSKNASQKIKQEARNKLDHELALLDNKLTLDKDPRDQTYLRNLRSIYESFLQDLEANKYPHITDDIKEQIDELFNICVRSLEHQHNLWRQSKRTNGKPREKILAKREAELLEIGKTVDEIHATIDSLQIINFESKTEELAKKRKELNRSLSVAKRINERIKALDDDFEIDLNSDS
jgi:hypothetical protein